MKDTCLYWAEASGGVVKRKKERAATGREWYEDRSAEKQLSAPPTTEIINDEAVTPESSNKREHLFWLQLLSELGNLHLCLRLDTGL